MDPQRFVKRLLRATTAMITSMDRTLSNIQDFWDHFTQGLDLSLEVSLIPLLDDFYLQDYLRIKDILDIAPHPAARRLMEH